MYYLFSVVSSVGMTMQYRGLLKWWRALSEMRLISPNQVPRPMEQRWLKKKEWLINRARYTNNDLLYVAAPTFYNWMTTDRYFLFNLFNYLKSLRHLINWNKFNLTCGWKSSKTTFLADELQFYQVQKIIFQASFL